MLLDVETTIASLKKYSDYRLYLKYLVTHASTEDYELAESALGYAMKEKGKKVGILTGDGHFYKILSKAIFKDLHLYKEDLLDRVSLYFFSGHFEDAQKINFRDEKQKWEMTRLNQMNQQRDNNPQDAPDNYLQRGMSERVMEL